MRTILIDPLARAMTEVQIDEGDTLRSWISKPKPTRMGVVVFDGESCGGTWDGFTVGSDADPGM